MNKSLILNPKDPDFDSVEYKTRIGDIYRPFMYDEVPIGVKMRDITNPDIWFGIVDLVLPGESPNYNRPVHSTLLGWCSPEDLLKSLEYFNGGDWHPCGVMKYKGIIPHSK